LATAYLLISELAKASGATVRSLHYYDKYRIGLADFVKKPLNIIATIP